MIELFAERSSSLNYLLGFVYSQFVYVLNQIICLISTFSKRTSDWSKILARLRIDQVTELGAAALEGPGGYIRAYDTIVRLSSLSDIELISSLGDVIMNEIRNPTNSRSSENKLSVSYYFVFICIGFFSSNYFNIKFINIYFSRFFFLLPVFLM